MTTPGRLSQRKEDRISLPSIGAIAGHDFRGRPSGGLRKRRRTVAIIDLAALSAGSAAGVLAIGRTDWLSLLVCLSCWFLATPIAGTLSSSALRMRRQAVATLLAATALASAGAAVILLVPGDDLFVAAFGSVVFAIGLVGRLVFYSRIRSSPIAVGLLADSRPLFDLWSQIQHVMGPGYRLELAIDPSDPDHLHKLRSVLTLRSIDLLVWSGPEITTDVQLAIDLCSARGIEPIAFSDLYEDLTGRCMDQRDRELALLPGSIWRNWGTRTVDLIAGMLLTPLWLVCAGGAALSGRNGERQMAIGRYGRRFERRSIGGNGEARKPFHGSRSGRVSEWALSAPSLLKGQMAVVGPRALTPVEMGAGKDWETRQLVRPGLTGWAAINGYHDPPDALPYDLYYVRRRSLGFDLGILLRSLAGPLLSWRSFRALAPVESHLEDISRPPVSLGFGDDELVSVIVPAYREGGHIRDSLEMLVRELSDLGLTFEVIVVSDGNTDGTEEEARALSEPVTVIHYPRNRGKGYALRRGLAESTGQRVVFIDADMELHPQGIGRLLSLLQTGADAAIGSKRHPESRVSYPLARRFQSRLYQGLVRALFGLDVTDTQTGIKAFRGPMVRNAAATLNSEGFAFDLELLVELQALGAVIVEGPVQLEYRFRSTTSPRATLEVLSETLRLWHRRRHTARRLLEMPGQEIGATSVPKVRT